VKDNDRSPAELRKPGFEVVLDGFVGVVPVDMEEVDAAPFEPGQRFVECHSEKGGETAISRAMKGAEVREDVFTVAAAVFVACPSIHRVATGGQAVALHSVEKRTIGDSRMGSELDQQFRAQDANQPLGKGDVTDPCAIPQNPRRHREGLRCQQIEKAGGMGTR
jgi:hypothetical protein